jgi:hypothetical protein
MEKEKIELILEDILDELKTVNSAMQEQKKKCLQYEGKIAAIEKGFSQLNTVEPPINTDALKSAIADAFIDIKLPKKQHAQPIIRQWRILLFPEQCSKEYYRVIFRLIMWEMLVFVIVVLFVLGKQALENNKEVKLKQIENNLYKNAWNYMYDEENKQGKKKMEDAWWKSCKTSYEH